MQINNRSIFGSIQSWNRGCALLRSWRFIASIVLVVGILGLFVWLDQVPFAGAIGKTAKFQWAQLEFPQSSDTRPTSLRRLMWMTAKRTSLEVSLEVPKIKVQDPRLFNYPLLYLSGETAFPDWPQPDIVRLRSHLAAGGTLFIDMTGGEPDNPFDQSVRRLIKRIFPQSPLQKLPSTHTLFRSFYLVQRLGGRRLVHAHIEGIIRDDRSPIIYSMNDHSGAWERDTFGHWVYPVVPGGEVQREHAFRFGINLIMYVLCVNYKQDGVHIPYIMQRRQ